jgi:uncharacterized protein YgbK (DUF1537 family)
LNVAVIADDLTGAADTGVQLARAGYRTAVIFRGEEIPAAASTQSPLTPTPARGPRASPPNR